MAATNSRVPHTELEFKQRSKLYRPTVSTLRCRFLFFLFFDSLRFLFFVTWPMTSISLSSRPGPALKKVFLWGYGILERMCTFSGTLTKDFFAPFTSDFEAWCFGIEWRATASERNKENGVKHVLDCFGDAIIYFIGYDSCTGKLVLNSTPPPPKKKKHSHKAVRHNTEAVLSGVGGFFWFLVFWFFFPFAILKLRDAAAPRKLNRHQTRFHWVISKGYFRYPPRLCFKAKLSAKLMVRKWSYILMQIKLVFTRKILHLATFRKEQVRSGLTDDLAYPDSGNGLV